MLKAIGKQFSKFLWGLLFFAVLVGNAQAAYYFDDSKLSISNITKGTAGSANDERDLASGDETDIVEAYIYLFNSDLINFGFDTCNSPTISLNIPNGYVSYYNTSYTVSESADGVSYTPLIDTDFTTTGVTLGSVIGDWGERHIKFQMYIDATADSISSITFTLKCDGSGGTTVYTSDFSIKSQMAKISTATDGNQQVVVDFPVDMNNDANFQNQTNYTIGGVAASSINVVSNRQVELNFPASTITGGDSINVKISNLITGSASGNVDLENTAGAGNQQYLTASATVSDTIAPTLESVVYDPNGGDNGQLRIIFNEGMETNSIASNYADIVAKLSLDNGHVLGTTTLTRTWTGTPTNTLTISLEAGHTVAAGDTLTIGAITDVAGNSASGESMTVSQTPMVVNVTSSNADGDYKQGETVTVQIEYSPAVIITGTPTLTLETGATDRTVNFVSSSDTGTGTILSFDYVVQEDDENAQLEYVNTTSLDLPDIINDTIKDQYGNNADLTLPTIAGGNSLTDNKNIKVDGIFPGFTAQRTAENTITITFTENVDADVADELTAWTVAGASVTAVTDPAGTSTLTITTSGLTGTEATPSVSYIAANGTVEDMVGNALEDTTKTATDAVVPTLTSAKFTADNQITLIFSEVVTALAIHFSNIETVSGAADLSVASISGSSSNTIVLTLNESLADTTLDAGQLDISTGVKDSSGNSFVGGTDQTINDGQAPNPSFIDDVDAGPVASDTITVDWDSASVKKWDYDADGTCSTVSGDYSFTDSNAMDQTTETNNGQYICLYTEDSNSNKSTLASSEVINVDITAPVISNPLPTGTQSSTGGIILQVNTNESATCKYNITTDTIYDSMVNTFDTT